MKDQTFKKLEIKNFKALQPEKGFAAIFVTVLTLVMVFSFIASTTILIYSQQKIINNIVQSKQAYYAAEAGIEDSLYRIIKKKEYDASNNLTVGKGTAGISITEESDSIVIKSTGEVVQRTRKLKVIISSEVTTITFHYGAQVGQGGLAIMPNARVIGNVYSNGDITGGGKENAEITGDAWVAGGVAATPDQECTSQNSHFPFGLKIDSIDYLDTAQSFVPSESKVLNRISFYLKKVGEPPDQTVRILTDYEGQPSDNSLGAGTLKSSNVTSIYNWVDVSLDSPPSLTAGQTYWIMIDVLEDDNNYWIWGKYDNDGYSAGTGKYTNDDWDHPHVIWTNIDGDLNFQTWMGGTTTSIDNVWVGIDAHANTILASRIDNDAYYQTIDDETTVGGTKHPDISDPASKDLPISYAQIQDWEMVASNTEVITPADGTYIPDLGSSLGPVKIDGNLTFPINSDKAPIIITGPVWVTGKILAENNVMIKLPDDLSFGYPIIADNPAGQTNNGQIEFNNNVITQDSAQGGSLLFVSTNKSLDMNNPAIWLHNGVNKDNAQSIIFSLQGLIKVENNAKFKEITGYGLYLYNNAEIVYETGLINAGFSSGPGGGWEVSTWGEVEE